LRDDRSILLITLFIPPLPLGHVAGAALLSLEILYGFQHLRQCCWLLTKAGPGQVGNVVTPLSAWSTSASFFCGYYQQDLSRQPFMRHSGHVAEFGEMTQHSGFFYKLHSCALRRELSHCELLAKFPSLTFVSEIASFQLLPEIHGHRWGSEQRLILKLTVLRCFKAPVVWPQRDNLFVCIRKVHSCLYWVSQTSLKHSFWCLNVYFNGCLPKIAWSVCCVMLQ